MSKTLKAALFIVSPPLQIGDPVLAIAGKIVGEAGGTSNENEREDPEAVSGTHGGIRALWVCMNAASCLKVQVYTSNCELSIH